MPDMAAEGGAPPGETGGRAGEAGGPPGLADPLRVQAFSDGVFAIIVTLLILDLRPPHVRPGGMLDALLHEWPSYLAFTISFVYVSVLWLNHHALFRLVARVDARLNWTNLALLFSVVVIPFPTATLAAAFAEGNRYDERVAVAFYALTATPMSVPWLVAFLYLIRHPELRAPGISDRYLRAQVPRPVTGIVLYGLSAVLGWFVDPVLGVAAFVVMIIFHAATSERMPTWLLRWLPHRPQA